MLEAAPLVSVVIPVYNAGPYVEATVRSALSQTYPNLEVVAVNDGSKDNSLAVLQGLAAQDPRVRVIDIPNQGVSVARNTGMNAATGKYVALLDADDLLAPDCLQLKVTALEQNPAAGLAHGDMELIDAQDKSLGVVLSGVEGNVYPIYASYGETPVPAACSNLIVRKSVVDEVGNFHPKLSTAADREFLMRVTMRYPVVRVPKVLAYYRMHGSNMHRNIKLLDFDENLIVELLSNNPAAFPSRAARNEYAAKIYLMLSGSWAKKAGEYRKGLGYLFRAILTYPPITGQLVRKLLVRT